MKSSARIRLILAVTATVGILATPVARGAAVPAGEDAAREIYVKAEDLVNRGRPGEAIAKFRTVVNSHRDTSFAPRAQLRIAQLYDRNRENATAFEAYQILIDHFPASDLYSQALEAQYRIAGRVLDAYALRERKGEDRTEEPLKNERMASRMLRILIENGRFAERAPEARFQLGVALEKEDSPRSAAEEHENFLEDYPGHPLADDAAFQVAYITYKLCKERNLEETYRKDAQLAFHYLLGVYPESPKAPMARHLLAELDSIEFNALVKTARYYDDQGDRAGATVYYRDIEKRFPDFISRIEWLPARLEQLPPAPPAPPAEEGVAPSNPE